MQSYHSSRQSLGARQEGIALIVTLMILMLTSALMVGFVAAVVADQRASGLDRDQTQAYAAAHAGMEQMTSDLSALFARDFSPNATQIAALRTSPPVLPGFTFIAPGGSSGSGYWVAPAIPDASGNPLPEDITQGSTITVGPYQGFKGIITPYDITITARATGLGGAEVRMKRQIQTVAIPVFQFGMFSETDLAFHAGAEAFDFGGRVHTNGNLFLAAADSGTLTIADRITAVGDVIRKFLPNGLATSTGYTGAVRIPTTIAQNPVNNVYRNLGLTEGSLTGTIPRTTSPSNENSVWYGLSTGTYKSNIRNGTTGAKRLDLPLVADLDSNGIPDAMPIELIKRPIPNENVASPLIYTQRYYSQASLRILLSDDSADITGLPGVCPAVCPGGADPINLGIAGPAGTFFGPAVPTANMRAPLALSGGPAALDTMPAGIYKSNKDQPLIGGWLKIEAQTVAGAWIDVTADILALGISGANPVDAVIATPSQYPITTGGTQRGAWSRLPASTAAANNCEEPHPNAVLRLQRIRDVPKDATLPTVANPAKNNRCGVTLVAGAPSAVTQIPYDYWPLALYDTREGEMRELNPGKMTLGGLMMYIELDIQNLRRWLAGTIGTQGTQARNDNNGYIVYFSDRRHNNNPAGAETGEYGYEDVVNLTNANGAPNAPIRDAGEDLNGNGALDTYGGTAKAQNIPAGGLVPFVENSTPVRVICPDAGECPTSISQDPAMIARANKNVLFRRALKLTDAALGNLPQGLTIVSENPVYVQGDYNATAASVTATTNVPAAIIADAVTLLSNAWNDMRSFTSPTQASGRAAATTGYRFAVVTGKGIPFPKPAGEDASFGSDGGAHNFVRLLENWDNGSFNRYRGSMVSFYTNRQATGTFKCCNNDAYTRGERTWSFDTDFLLPTKLPPGTPMFRDVNTLTFRQLLRPTQ